MHQMTEQKKNEIRCQLLCGTSIEDKTFSLALQRNDCFEVDWVRSHEKNVNSGSSMSSGSI